MWFLSLSFSQKWVGTIRKWGNTGRTAYALLSPFQWPALLTQSCLWKTHFTSFVLQIQLSWPLLLLIWSFELLAYTVAKKRETLCGYKMPYAVSIHRQWATLIDSPTEPHVVGAGRAPKGRDAVQTEMASAQSVGNRSSGRKNKAK